MPDLSVLPVWRSQAYREYLRDHITRRQRCGAAGPTEEAHGPRRRPWIGMQNGTWSPGHGKTSDFGILRECHACNMLESDDPRGAWMEPRERDRICLQNLIAYVSHLDSGINLEAEILEWVQERMAEFELNRWPNGRE